MFEDTKGAIKSRKSKIPKGQSKAVNLRYQRGNQKPYIEGQTCTTTAKKDERTNNDIYKTLHRRLKIEQQHETH